MQPDPHATEIFLHVRVVMGIMLGMSMTRLLTGAARFVQHPGKQKIYLVHLGWVASMLLTLIHFWWWEFRLYGVQNWNFQIYFFLIFYTIVLFLLCTLLFPDNIAEYSGYEDFFISRRKWFFGLLGLTYVFDLVDTLLKGRAYYEVLRKRISDPRARLRRPVRPCDRDAEPLVSGRARGRQSDLSGDLDRQAVRHADVTRPTPA